MSTSIVTVEPDDTLKDIKDIFDHVSFHHLLVVESGRLFGMISDRDLLKALSPNIGTAAETARDLATLNKRAHQIMSRKPLALPPTANIRDAVAAFNNHPISSIPIVDPEHRPVGIVSWRDLLSALGSYLDMEPPGDTGSG